MFNRLKTVAPWWICWLLFVNALFAGRERALAQAGALDLSFQCELDAEVRDMALQEDGKIILAGAFQQVNGTAQSTLARLNSDGSLDTSFRPHVPQTGEVSRIMLMPDGDILAVNCCFATGGNPRSQLFHFKSNGALDTNFISQYISGAGTDYTVLEPYSGNKILFGTFLSVYSSLFLLNSNGSTNTEFTVTTGPEFRGYIGSLAIMANGQIMLGGTFTTVNGLHANRLVRLNPDGSRDFSFDASNQNIGGDNRAILPLPNNRGYIIGGDVFTRLSYSGRIDTNYVYITGLGRAFVLHGLLLMGEKVLIVGNFFFSDDLGTKNISRRNANGSLDSTFEVGTGTDGPVRKALLLPDGKVLIGGKFTNYNGVRRTYIARLHGDNPTLGSRKVNDNQISLSWPRPYSNFVLQTTTSLSSSNWITLSNVANVKPDELVTMVPSTGANRFFRLVRP